MGKFKHIGIAGVGDRTARTGDFIASAPIAIGTWVALDLAAAGEQQGLQIAVGGVNGACIGVALEAAAAAGDVISVCIGGYCTVANLPAVTAGDSLTPAAAGAVTVTVAADVHAAVAVALDTLALPGVGSVYIYDKVVQV